MASSKIKGINIKIGADTRGLDTALKGIENKSKSAKNELFEINKSIKSTPDSLTLWRQKQEVLTKAIADSREKVKLLEDAQEEVAKQLKDGKINGETYRAFQRELENARSESSRLENQLQDTNKKIYDLENGTKNSRKGVDKLGDSMENAHHDADKLGDSMEGAGKDAEKASDGYTVFKDVLGNLVTQGINFAIEKVKAFTTEIIETGKAFEASMSNVGAISGATSEELDKLSEKAKQMGASTKYTASQAADAFSYMALAGWKTEDMLAGIDGVLSLAAASNMDLALASDIVTDYLTAFGLTAQDSAKFVDQMSFAMSNSNTTTELLGEAYKNCAATASSMGYSVEDTTAVLMTMANAGVKGGEAGTALNAIMTRLATNTQGCANALKKYADFDIYQNGKMQNLSNILEGVSGAWKTLNEQEQAAFAKQIAGVNHFSALQTIMNGLSDSAKESGMSFTDYSAALEECDGTAQGMATTMIDNLAGDMTILDSSIDGVKIALSEKLNPIMRDLVQYITEKMPEIQKSSEKALDTVVVIAEWCKKHMPEIKETAKDLIPYIIGIGSGFAGWNVATKVTSVINKLFGVVKSGSVYMKLLNAVMSANPAVAVTTAIVGLTGAIIAWKKVQEDEISIADKVNEKYKEQTEKINKTKDTINDLKQAFCDSAAAIDYETQKTKDLWKELHNLGGQSGEVRNEDRKRAEYIMKELNEALGTEYTMTGNQIENYQNLSKEIDKVIQKKQAEAYIDSWLAQSSEMAKQKKDSENEYIEFASDAETKRKERQDAWKVFHDSVKDTGNKYLRPEEIMEIVNSHHSITVVTEEQSAAAEAYLDAIENEKSAKKLAEEAKASYNQAVDWQNTLDEAMYLSENDKPEEAIKLMENFSGIDLSAYEHATKDEKLTAYNILANALKHRFNLAIESNNQSEIDSLLEDLAYNLNEGQELGLSFDELFNPDVQEALKNIISKGYNISEFTKYGKDSGYGIDEFLGPDYSKIFSNQIQEDYNVDDMLEWIGNSEKEIAKESWEDFKTYVYKEIEKNEKYDITPILKSAKKAGIDVGEAFGGDYMGLVQKQINEGLDPTELIKWFAETDEKAAKYFKENYKDVTQSLIDEGYDPTQMLLQFTETDKEFAKNFKENGIDVVQNMLDKGFNPIGLMQWFFNNEVDITKSFTDKMKKEFEKTDYSGIKLEGLFNHLDKLIQTKAAEEADVYGKYFTDYVNQYLYKQKVDFGEIRPNSQWDADLYNGNVNYALHQSLSEYKKDEKNKENKKYSQFATGGYISAGNKGIVAEAGPELLEIMNGGVRVTPLKGNSRNTAVSDSTAGQKIFYNTYNINNPRMSNDMDIRQVAQKLAIEQRRIEKGRGL